MNLRSVSLASVLVLAAAASAQIRITEWQYNGSEFVELTNMGAASVDLTGWTFNDNTPTGTPATSLSDFGLVASGESVIVAEATAAEFRTLWGLGASVKVVGGNANNLGRNDAINIFDASQVLVDTLAYNDQAVAGDPAKGPRTDVNSGNFALAALGTNTASSATISAVGDAYGSFKSTDGLFTANPGKYAFAPVPEPSALAALGLGAFAMVRRRRKA